MRAMAFVRLTSGQGVCWSLEKSILDITLAGSHAPLCSCGRGLWQQGMEMGRCACMMPAQGPSTSRSVPTPGPSLPWTSLQRWARSVSCIPTYLSWCLGAQHRLVPILSVTPFPGTWTGTLAHSHLVGASDTLPIPHSGVLSFSYCLQLRTPLCTSGS